MNELKRVAVGIDFGTKTNWVLRSAVRLARRVDAAIDLIHVVRPPVKYTRILLGTRQMPDVDEITAAAREHLEALAAAEPLAGLAVSCQVAIGAPDVELTKIAEEQHDDLIVLGPSTRHRAGPFGAGRTPQRVVRKAAAPVLVVKRLLAETPSCVAVTTDFSIASEPAIEEAARFAKLWGAKLVLVHVIEPAIHLQGLVAKVAGASDIYTIEPKDLEPEWAALLESVDLGGLKAHREVVKGEPVEAIVSAVDQVCADLLVIGTHGRSGVARAVLGSTAEDVLAEATCPILVVRSVEPDSEADLDRT